MKALKIIGNIFGILFAIVLSILLLVTLIASPIVTAASDFVKPETIRETVTKIDIQKVLVDNNIDLGASMEDYGIPSEAVVEIMKTDAVGEVVELYAKELTAAISGEDVSYITPDAIKQIADENLSDLVDIIFDFIPEEEIPEDMTVEEMKTEVETKFTEYVDTNAEEIVSFLPSPKELIVETVDTEIIETIRYVQNGTFTTALWIAIAVLSLLIFGCRWPRFKGFMWLGVVFLLGAAFTFVLSSVFNTALIDYIIAMIPGFEGVVAPAMATVSASIIKMGIILAALTALFIAVFVVGRVFLAKKKKAVATVNNAPVSETFVADTSVAEQTEPAQETVIPEEEPQEKAE